MGHISFFSFSKLYEIFRGFLPNSVCISVFPVLQWWNIRGAEKGARSLVTLEDIAQALSLSKSTVSKALSGARDVSEATRKSVLEKAVELGYSRLPRSAAAPRIAVFITNMEYTKPEDFGYEIIVGFRKAAEPAGFRVELIPLDAAMQAAMPYDEFMVLGGYCGGFFLGMTLLDPWIREFETCRTPTVLYDNHIDSNPNVTHVGVDSKEGLELAVSHLKHLGHKVIGYLGSEPHSYVYQQRQQSFLAAMEQYGLHAPPELTGTAHHISDCLSLHLPRLLRMGCTAVVCSHDVLASSVMIHCGELGLRIPDDISIIGFDDIPLCRYTVPPLSTIRQNRAALGKSAFFALSSQLNAVHLSTFLLHAELIVRASCAPPNSK